MFQLISRYKFLLLSTVMVPIMGCASGGTKVQIPNEDSAREPSSGPSAEAVDAMQISKPGCFSPSTVPAIAGALAPSHKFNETPEDIMAMHRLIYAHRNDIDPRLVYYRLLGESRGNPYAVNPSSGAYGMFQLLGKPFGSRQTYRQILEDLYRKSPRSSPRMIQIEYYLNHYVANFKRAADQGYGCIRKKFDEYSDLEKVSYLGWGGCKAANLANELNLCKRNASYRTGGCSFTTPLFSGHAIPLCQMP